MSDEKMVDVLKRSKCANCSKIFDDGEMKAIEHLSERVSAGDKIPSGECGECGSLCFQMALDMPAMNLERASWALKAIEAFGEANGVAYEHEPDSAVADLLADLMHLCDRDKIDFDAALDKGRRYYNAEIDCSECGEKLKAGDNAKDCDAMCAKCLEKWEKAT